MKRTIFIVSLILILTLFTVTAFADEIIVRIDSNNVEFNEEIGKPFIDENYRTQVPFRATLEKFGAKVEWNNEQRTAVATKGTITVEVPIGESYILKNGEKITTDTVARIVNSRTYLPIRAVVEAFGSEVQWDSELNTVVITTDPIDAKALLMKAYEKSYDWKNYEGNITMDMCMSIPDENGIMQLMNMNMNMYMTAFMDPMKLKLNADMNAEFQGEKINQPVMDMYMTVDKEKMVMYMGVNDGTGSITWSKSVIDDEMLSELINYDIQANLQLTEKYTKDVKFLGKYSDNNGNTLLRIQNTVSGEIYTDLLGSYLDQVASTTNTQDLLSEDMFKNLGDFTFVIFVNDTTGEIVKYEMDLGSIYKSMFGNMTASDAMPQEAIDAFKNIEAKMIMDIININNAKDFEIPKEALNAPEVSLLNQ